MSVRGGGSQVTPRQVVQVRQLHVLVAHFPRLIARTINSVYYYYIRCIKRSLVIINIIYEALSGLQVLLLLYTMH